MRGRKKVVTSEHKHSPTTTVETKGTSKTKTNESYQSHRITHAAKSTRSHPSISPHLTSPSIRKIYHTIIPSLRGSQVHTFILLSKTLNLFLFLSLSQRKRGSNQSPFIPPKSLKSCCTARETLRPGFGGYYRYRTLTFFGLCVAYEPTLRYLPTYSQFTTSFCTAFFFFKTWVNYIVRSVGVPSRTLDLLPLHLHTYDLGTDRQTGRYLRYVPSHPEFNELLPRIYTTLLRGHGRHVCSKGDDVPVCVGEWGKKASGMNKGSKWQR